MPAAKRKRTKKTSAGNGHTMRKTRLSDVEKVLLGENKGIASMSHINSTRRKMGV